MFEAETKPVSSTGGGARRILCLLLGRPHKGARPSGVGEERASAPLRVTHRAMLGTAPKSSDFPRVTACGVPKCTSGISAQSRR